MARMTVTFTEEIHYEITRLASLQGVTKSSVINELLQSALPAMRNISHIIEHLRTATQEEKDAFKAGLDDLAQQAQSDSDYLKSQMDLFNGVKRLRSV